MPSTDVEIRLRIVDQYTKGIREAQRALRGLEQSGSRGMAAAAGRQGAAAKAGGGGIGMPLGFSPGMIGSFGAGAALKSAVAEVADFEEALLEIRKKAGLTADETARVGEEIKNLSVSGDVIASIDDIAKAYERGGAAGIPLGELKEFAAVSAKAADAFGISAEDASNAIAGWQKNLQMSNGDIKEMLDLVNALGDAGTADEADIVGFLSRSGSPLAAKGFDPQEVAALGATMLNLGVDWETASRSINSSTTRILSPASKQARKALTSLFGGDKEYEAFRERFTEDGMSGLTEFLDKLGALKDLDQLDSLQDIIGAEFGPVIQRLISARQELQRNLDLQANKDSWLGGLDRSYDLKKTSFWSQWQLLKNEFGKLTIDIGTNGLPALKTGLEEARAIFTEIGDNLSTFEAKINIDELEKAKVAVRELMTLLDELMNKGGGDTAIERFFNRVAALTDSVSGTINMAKDGLQFLGLVDEDEDTPDDRQQRRRAVVENLGDLSPPIQYGTKLYDSLMEDWTGKGGRVSSRPLPEISADRFVGAQQPSGAPPTPPLAPPDMVSYFTALGQAEQARIPVEQPIVTSADLNTAAFMAGLGQMTAAARATRAEIQSILGGLSAGGGGGNDFESHKRSQFAPVGPTR